MSEKANSKKGMAVPVVLMFCFCTTVMAISMFYFRTESKQQNLVNFHFLQVNFLAQSAVQHMLLKLSAFPQDAYDAGVLSLGYCPFRGIQFGEGVPAGIAEQEALERFASDCNTQKIRWNIPATIAVPGAPPITFDASQWSYRVEQIEIVNAYFEPLEKRNVLTTQIVAIGESTFERGQLGDRTEQLTKTVQLTGQN